ncbi:hypothetical protein P167DRAFT_556450 [Morchella conica CCBAS932]|uniref:GDSL lipase/acylhydrolase family protein n=2 Tax=Morchella sect. Distantes TaxID=1051054 RepID=A0A3N4L1Q5_9PEZI|nr:hypothetical protein P167DRAFT_556450 [Morchella conica CCBAS932]
MFVQIPVLSTLLLALSAYASPLNPEEGAVFSRDSAALSGGKFKNLVVFGDSYTDEGRLGYFFSHNGSAPPVGYVQQESSSTASGGRSWARFVAQYTGVTLYNYAVSGAVCSNSLTPRYLSSINGLFPDILGYEVPAFFADFPKESRKLSNDETLYAIWIGTNDLGGDNIITGLPNVGLTNYTSCVFETMSKLYNYGARNFVLLSLAPIEHAPLYAPLSEGGSEGPHRFWRGRSGNATVISTRMRDLVQGGNEIFKYRVPAEIHDGALKGAKVAMMDTYGLLTDIRINPANYLNGSLPLNVTGFNLHCVLDGPCTTYRPNDRDSFLWYDELHPSEQVGRIVAREFSKFVQKKFTEWMTVW